ncbi:hypothetical protein B0H19DRAFT_80456 [Mycena capillaripes]|nr:hypothetical protein B0H19DRAFT_80456 [Mycena capillaripes]
MDYVVPFNLHLTIGAYQIGVLVSYILFGVTTTQTYVYYSRFPDDSLKIKALVAFVWVCEFGHALCLGHTLYIYTISDYMHPERLAGNAPLSLATAVFLASVITACVQGFFSFRIYAFSKKILISMVIWVLVSLRLLGGTVSFVTGLMISPARWEAHWGWLATSVLSVSVAADLTITGTLVFLLYGQRISDHKRTVALVDKLIAWTIETGMLTSGSGICALVFILRMPTSFVYLAFNVIETRVFSNSLLASLNSRAALREMNEISLPSLGIARIETNNGAEMGMIKMPQIMHDSRNELGGE